MAHRWIVTVLGKDCTGIVAGVTEVLYKLHSNLEDSAMTRLEGEFTMMLIFSAPASVSQAVLANAFAAVEKKLNLSIHLKALSAQETSKPHLKGKGLLISVYGADRPGIVFKVSEILARAGINIIDVHTHRSRGRAPSLYLMLLEVEAPARIGVAGIKQRLGHLAKSLGVEVSVRSSEAAVL